MAFDLEAFKRSVNLVDFIKTHYPTINLEKRGQEWFITCPFCDDDHPSCVVNQNKTDLPQFHCFQGGCNFDLYQLVAHQEHLDVKLNFKEVVTLIATKTNQTVNFAKPNPFYEQFKKKKTSLMNSYHDDLLTSVEELNYILNRGITEETIREFKLGLKSFVDLDYTGKNIATSRIVFPIFECVNQEKAKCVGMSYRFIGNVPGDLKIPKYKNDPNQVGDLDKGQDQNVAGVFIKGNFLYGYSHNMKEIRNHQEIYLVEGYMDVISLYQANIHQAVSIMGTNISEEQIKLLKSLTSNITLLLDSDKAGQKAMRKALPILLKNGFNVSIIDFKNGKDPADVCLAKKFNENAIRRLFDSYKENALTYCLTSSIKRYQSTVVPLRIEILKECETLIEYIEDPIEREVQRRFVRKELDLN